MSLLHGLITFILLIVVFRLARRVRQLEAAHEQIRAALIPGAEADEAADRQAGLQGFAAPIQPPTAVDQQVDPPVDPHVVAPPVAPPAAPSSTENRPALQPQAQIQSSETVTSSAPERVLATSSALSPSAGRTKVAKIASAADPISQSGSQDEEVAKPKTSWSNSPLIGWFLRSHALVQVGMIILFIGVAFLLKLVADQSLLSIEMRLAGAALGGVLLAGFGFYLRKRARTYALALQGGGLGIIYLTTFFAYRVYELLPPTLAFSTFVVLGIGCATLAVLNNARILAFLAIVGAFLAPILASDGGGNHVMLFSYYAVVNAAILAIAWFRAWRSLNLVGFLFTVIAAVAWGNSSYEASLFNSTEPFLILFFLFYVAIAILFSLRGTPGGTPIDVMLIFGNPLATLSMQAALVQHIDDGLGWSALVMGAFYTILAVALMRLQEKRRPLLTESLLFLGFLFLTISVPLFFEAQVTSATWAISGAASVWLGTKRRQVWSILWGIGVQAVAALAFVIYLGQNDIVLAPPVANAFFLGAMILALAAFSSGYLLRKPEDYASESPMPEYLKVGSLFFSLILSGWGMLWWYGSGIVQIIDYAPEEVAITGILAFMALSAGVGEFLGLRLVWRAVRIPALLFIGVMAVLAFVQLFTVDQPFGSGGLLAWPLAFVIHYWALHNRQKPQEQPSLLDDARLFVLHHAGGLWLLTFLLTWFAAWQIEQLTTISNLATMAIIAVPSLIILVLSWFINVLPWPFNAHRKLYITLGLGPLAAFALFWALGGNLTNNGASAPLTYLPLLNPLGLAQIVMFGALFVWRERVQPKGSIILNWVWGLALFAAVNLSIARAIHHLGGVAYTFDALYSSEQLQTIYAIFWGALALALVFIANRRQRQPLWLAGIVLLGATVLKLFVVDLANSGSVARIISFIGVGLLTIAIAYFAPAPTSEEGLEESEQEVVKEISVDAPL